LRRRHELNDEEWAIIEPLLPNRPRGVPRVDDRQVIDGILWLFRTGAVARRAGTLRAAHDAI
jgi:transposase